MSKRKAPPRRDRDGPASTGAPRTRGSHWLFGRHAVVAALLNPARRCRQLLATTTQLAALEAEAGTAFQQQPGLSVQPTERDRLDALLPGALHQGVVLEVEPLATREIEEALDGATGSVMVLDQISDGRNLGAILRSTAAFGGAALVLPRDHAPPIDGVVAKAASGALEIVPLVTVPNLARALEQLKELGFWCVGLDAAGPRPLAELALSERTALVLGSEGRGLRRLTRERCDVIAHLPTRGAFRTLNVASAAAAALYEIARGPRA